MKSSKVTLFTIFFFLLLIPFFWFPSNLYVLGDDDTGLSYYNPYGVLNVSLSSWFSFDHVAQFDQLSGYAAIFSLVLATLRLITFNLINVQQLAFGFIMSFSFLYIVKILELLSEKKDSYAFYVAGLFYSLSAYFIMVEYYYMLPSTYAIVLAPAMTYYLLKSVINESYAPLVYGAMWSFFLSRAIYTPTFINFFLLLPVFVLLFLFFNFPRPKIVFFAKAFGLYLVLIAVINSITILPLLASYFEKGSGSIATSISVRNNPEYIKNMLSYIETEIEQPRMMSYLLNIFPKTISSLQGFRNFGFYEANLDYTSFLMFLIPFFSFCGLAKLDKREKRKIIPVLILFIVSLLFLFVNLVDEARNIYFFLMKYIPIFNMNRIPSMKFHTPYIFYLSLLVGLSIHYLTSKIKQFYGKIIIITCLVVITSNSLFFLTGKLFSTKNDQVNGMRIMDFNDDYKKLISDLPGVIQDDTNLLLFPLGYGYGAFITGQDRSQYYRSTVTGFKSFTGYNLYGNLKVINSALDTKINDDAKDYYFKFNQKKLANLAQKLNIRYIIYFKHTDELRKFAEVVPEFTYESKTYYSLVDKTKPIYQNDSYSIYKINNYNSISQFTTSDPATELSFKKIADFMYFIKIKTNNEVDVIMHEGYSNKWKTYDLDPTNFECANPRNYAKNYPNILECKHTKSNLEGNKMLLGLINLPEEKLSHSIFQSFENKWTINTKGKTRYYAVIFEPQKYYILGSLISIISLVGFVTYLFYHGKNK